MDTLKYRYYSETREQRTLVLFPDKPFWFIASPIVLSILRYFDGKETLENTKNQLINFYNFTTDFDGLLQYVFNTLNEAKLFEENPKKTNSNPISIRDMLPVPVFNITKNCNLACRHCYADARYTTEYDSKTDLNTDQWKKVMDTVGEILKSRNEDRMLLTGGEPFLREDIMELIRHIHSIGFKPFINTNSLLIKDEQMRDLAKYKAELLVSVDGSSKEIHEYLRGKNTFDETVLKIKKLKESGVITKLSYTVHTKNLDEIEGFLRFAGEAKADQVAINNLSVLHRADISGIERVNTKDLNEKLYELAQQDSSFCFYINRTDFTNLGAILKCNMKFSYCGVGSASLCIDSNGDLYPCYNTMVEEFRVGNVLEDDLTELWSKSPVLEELRSLNVDEMNQQCAECLVRYYCGGGCRGETYYRYKDIRAPYPFCEDTQKTIIDMMFLVSKDYSMFTANIEDYEKLKKSHLSKPR